MLYYFDDKIKLYQGDALEILEGISPGSVDMIFADPPYNLSNDGFTCQSGRMVSVNKGEWDRSKGLENDFEFHIAWLSKCKNLLTDNGTIWISGTYHSIYTCGYAMQKLGYHFLNDIIWYKTNASPNLSCRFFTASHETLIWAKKNKNAKHYFNYNLMKEIKSKEDFLKIPNKQMRSVWAINPPKPNEKKLGKHNTQKPVSLLERIILASTEENNMILDPFVGSGTTGVAANKYNRHFIGIDMEEKFLDLTVKRLKQNI